MGAEGQAALRERPGADLLLLEEFDVQEARLGLAGDMGKTTHAAYALELCDRLCPSRHAEPAVFDWLREFLLRLEAGRASAERLRVFELGLLARLGLGPALDRCAVCGRSDLGGENTRWHPERGGGCVYILRPPGRHPDRRNTPGARPPGSDGVGRRSGGDLGPGNEFRMPAGNPWAGTQPHRRASAFAGLHRKDGRRQVVTLSAQRTQRTLSRRRMGWDRTCALCILCALCVE